MLYLKTALHYEGQFFYVFIVLHICKGEAPHSLANRGPY